MLKPTASRIVWALLSGFVLILIAAWFSGSTVEICQGTKLGQENCAPYNLAPFVLIQIREALHSIEGVMTALATVAIAWFTWTLRQSTEKMWLETKKAADAADLSAKAVTIVEFPIIRTAWIGPNLLAVEEMPVHGDDYHGILNQGPPTKFSVIADIEYRNYGRSPAFPIEMLIRYFVGNKLPENPTYRSHGHTSPVPYSKNMRRLIKSILIMHLNLLRFSAQKLLIPKLFSGSMFG